MKFKEIQKYAPQKMFLLQGNDDSFEDLVTEARKLSPLAHVLSVPRFTMDHAKDVANFAVEGDGTGRLLLVYFSIFSPDAAQVLLKSLEEPDKNTVIILMTPHPYVVPQTIRSRVMLLQTTREAEDQKNITQISAQAFIKNELSSDSDVDAATRRAKAVAFLDQLELMYKKTPAKADVIYEAKKMLFMANIPTKYVVEYAVTCVF